tara:strand:+ start:3830 stop:4549 length:720 start_codon:yes stop_codon:yes gene_type:complete
MVMKFSQRGIVCALLLFSFARANEPVAETEKPTLEDYYQVGSALFDTFAPPEIKAQFEFPMPQQWMEFATRLQNTLQGDSLEDLIIYEPEARAALRAMPGYEDYAEWLEGRLDYIDAAKQVTPAPPLLPSVQPKKQLAEEIPHLQLWRDRMQTRAVPSRAAKLVPKLRAIFADEGMPHAVCFNSCPRARKKWVYAPFCLMNAIILRNPRVPPHVICVSSTIDLKAGRWHSRLTMPVGTG